MALLLIPMLLLCNSIEDLVVLAFLILLLASKEVLPLADDPECDIGHYLNVTCMPCLVCAEGYGIKHTCEGDKNTVCEQCPPGKYSKQISGNRFCMACTDCLHQNRNSVSNCTQKRDTVCGRCSKGHFLQVSRDGSTFCAECSLCPPDKEAMRWYECADMPDNQQCAPGYYEESSIEPAVTESSPNVLWRERFFNLANRTEVFLPIASQDKSSDNQPWLGGLISAVSLFFTLLTLAVFVCSLQSFCKKLVTRYRSTNRRPFS